MACRRGHQCKAPRLVTGAARIQAQAWGTGGGALHGPTPRGGERACTLFPARMRVLTQQSQSRRASSRDPIGFRQPPRLATPRGHVSWEQLKDPPLPGRQTRTGANVSTRGSCWKGVLTSQTKQKPGEPVRGGQTPRAGPHGTSTAPVTNSPNVALLVLSPSQDSMSPHRPAGDLPSLWSLRDPVLVREGKERVTWSVGHAPTSRDSMRSCVRRR